MEVSQGVSENEFPELVYLAEEHLSEASSDAPKTVFTSLGPVKNVDRLKAKQPPISFAVNGITLIYGPPMDPARADTVASQSKYADP